MMIQRVLILSAVAATAATTTTGCGPVCGDGTIEQDGECVAAEGEGEEGEGEEGEGEEGEGEEGEGEGEELICGAGTVAQGGVCVPACRDDEVFVDGNCECPAGYIEVGGALCQLDGALCGEGTTLQGTECLPLPAPTNVDDDQGAAPVLTVPPIGEKSEPVGGVIDPPRDGTLDQDIFTFTGTAGMRLRVELVSFGAESASFAVVGTAAPGATTNLDAFVRFGLPGDGRRALRDVVLPLDGDYQIVVGDKAVFAGGLPSTAAGQSYGLVIEQIAEPAAIPLLADAPQTALHGAIPSYVLDTTTIPAGLADVTYTSNDVNTIGIAWFIDGDGAYAEFDAGAATFVPQSAVGTVVHADFLAQTDLSVAAAADFSIVASPIDINDGPDAGDTLDGNTNGEALTFFRFDLDAGNVYQWEVEFPLTTSIDGQVVIVNADLAGVAQCVPGVNDAGRDIVTCRRFVADDVDAGEHFLVVLGAEGGLVDLENTQFRVSFAQAPVTLQSVVLDETTAITVADVDADGEFGAPWFRVVLSDPTRVLATGVEFDVHDVATVAALAEGLTDIIAEDNVEQAAGFSFLVRPREVGTLSISGEALPYVFEDEATNNAGDGDTAIIPEDADLDLDAGSVAGVSSASDVDVWKIAAPGAPGVVTVTASAQGDDGPFDPDQLFGEEATGNILVQLFTADGVTALTEPTVGSIALFLATGDDDIVVKVTNQDIESIFGTIPGAGTYTLGYAFDDTGVAPATCAAPGVLDGSAPVTGDLRVAPRAAAHTPPDATCFGLAPDIYSGGEDAYLVTIPANGAVVVDVEAEFDVAIAILDANTCNGTCVAGADNNFPFFGDPDTDTLSLRNETDAAVTRILVVEGFQGDAGIYTLTAQIFGGECRLGETQCEGDVLRTCNADGSAFEARTCLAGCAFDAFDQIGTCNLECGAPGTLLEEPTCGDVDTLRDCVDGLIVERECAEGCSDVAGADICAVCVADEATCAIDGDGFDVAVVCNADGTAETTTVCAAGCTAGACDLVEGESCAAPLAIVVPAVGSLEQVIDTSAAVSDIDGSCAFLGATGGGDIVFSFVAPGDGVVTIANELGDVVIYAFEGVCGGTEVGCIDDFLTEALDLPVTGGITYFVVVDAFDNTSGEVDEVVTFSFVPN
jgi:hypothetical protein